MRQDLISHLMRNFRRKMTNYIYEEIEPISDDYLPVIKRTDELGNVSWIPADPANSDYQTYLNKDKLQVEHLTEKPTE